MSEPQVEGVLAQLQSEMEAAQEAFAGDKTPENEAALASAEEAFTRARSTARTGRPMAISTE
jgi:hypothetical protein